MMPDGYAECVEKMMKGGIAWIREHGLSGLEFHLPPEGVMFMCDLPPAIPRLAKTDSGKEFLGALEAAAPGEGTAFQAICVIRILELPETTWSEKDYDGTAQLTRGGTT